MAGPHPPRYYSCYHSQSGRSKRSFKETFPSSADPLHFTHKPLSITIERQYITTKKCYRDVPARVNLTNIPDQIPAAVVAKLAEPINRAIANRWTTSYCRHRLSFCSAASLIILFPFWYFIIVPALAAVCVAFTCIGFYVTWLLWWPMVKNMYYIIRTNTIGRAVSSKVFSLAYHDARAEVESILRNEVHANCIFSYYEPRCTGDFSINTGVETPISFTIWIPQDMSKPMIPRTIDTANNRKGGYTTSNAFDGTHEFVQTPFTELVTCTEAINYERPNYDNVPVTEFI